MTAADFAREHGDPATWFPADWDAYDHLAEMDAWDAASEAEHRRLTDPAEPPPAEWMRWHTDTTTGGTR